MKQSPIIIIINKKPYTLFLDDKESIRSLPKIDRQQLITLLEALKQLETPAVSEAQALADNNTPTNQNIKSADPDAMMAQLIMQEELNKKPEVTKQTIQKWIAGSAIVIILLILIFS